MPTLYVTETGARVEKEYQKLIVTREDEVLAAVPLAHVSQVALIGNVGVTTPAMHHLLEHGVDLTLLSAHGKLRGRLVAAEGLNVALRKRQYERAADPAFCLRVARAIVRGKLQNYRALAWRLARARRDDAMRRAADALGVYCGRALEADDLASLRGVEGAGSKVYFSVLRAALRQPLGCETRERRPPPDPVNALLSFGYTLLGENLYSALAIAGLDPHCGFFHADAYGRPSLALDLVEEFRALIADSVALTLVNRRVLKAKDFQPTDDGGVHLKEHGLRRYLRHYARRLNTVVAHPLSSYKVSYQKIFEVQARQLRRVIEGTAEEYQPFRTR